MLRTLALLVALALCVPAQADTLIDNVNGITLNEKGGVERFSGVVIGKDGRIAQVLSRGAKRPKTVDYLVDGKGRVLLPGMINAHANVMDIGFGLLTLDLSGTRSLDEALAKIAHYAQEHPNRPWILGRGWDEELWRLGRFPTAAELDRATGNRPVWLQRVDGHAGWANSAALAAAGVTAATQNPPGGRIERTEGRMPAGVLVGKAADLITARVPPPRAEDRDVAFALAQQHLIERGFTTVTDMGTTMEAWQTFRRAGDKGALRLRIIAYGDGVDAMALIGGPGPTPWLYDDRLRLNGVKLQLDGALGSRGAALKAPYADAPGQSGLMVTSEIRLGNMMSRAAIDNFQVAVHAAGDRANAVVLDAIGELSATYKGDRRWRIEHAQVIDPVDIARFGRNGIIASMQPQQLASDRLMVEARLGPDRLTGVHAWKSIAASGAVLAFGDDAPVGRNAPFAALATAITREGADGQPVDGWQPQERLGREQALAALTTGAARAGFAEDRLGRIAKGLRADFLLVDADPLLATPDALRRIRVLETWINGQMVHRAKEGQAPAPAGR